MCQYDQRDGWRLCLQPVHESSGGKLPYFFTHREKDSSILPSITVHIWQFSHIKVLHFDILSL